MLSFLQKNHSLPFVYRFRVGQDDDDDDDDDDGEKTKP